MFISVVLPIFASACSNYRAEVLGPLNQITDFGKFASDLQLLKSIGVKAMATDVWWGNVEVADQQFDWSYYDRLSNAIVSAGLQWIPIMSTHQCGGPGQGNTGSSCNVPVPAWTNIKSQSKYSFVDVYGTPNTETFSPWSGDYPYTQYGQLFNAFASHYAHLSSSIPRIDLSGGSSGELKFPSYSSASWSYPSRGQLQAYSPEAVADFQSWAVNKYGSPQGVGKAWGSSIQSINDIKPPCNVGKSNVSTGVCAGQVTSDTFFSNGINSVYGRDFGSWYQGVLIQHATRLAGAAHTNFGPAFPNTRIALKFSGVHWQYFSPSEPHSGERSAGYWDYNVLLRALKALDVEATFTAVEMNDNNNSPQYSGAKSLVNSFYSTCQSVGICCGGENALPIFNGNGDSYSNMRNAIKTYSLTALTYLRYDQLTTSNDNAQAYKNSLSDMGGRSKRVY